ncbi:MAG: DUF1801 domain-containing protein [Phycisphaerales bacterium]|nr:DUF1801 domain-containing protein [Phycisphaerales bacterium]
MQSKASTVDQYLAELPPDRREAISTVRDVIRKNLPKGYEEGMTYGMIGYYVPHSIYPDGYHCDPKQPLPFASLASQKNHMAIYLMCCYGHPETEAWFREAWAKTGKKLDMGKSCVRFKKLDDIPLSVIGQVIKRVPVKKYIAFYESAIKKSRPTTAKQKAAKATGKKTEAKKSPVKKTAKKKAAKKKAASKKVASKKAASKKARTKRT